VYFEINKIFYYLDNIVWRKCGWTIYCATLCYKWSTILFQTGYCTKCTNDNSIQV